MGIESALLAAGMGAGTASTVATGLSIFSGLSSIVGGMQQSAEAKRQANYAQGTAMAQATEQARVSALQAGAERKEAESYRRQQKLAYLKSGVSLEGSPLLMLESTRLRGQKNVNEIISAGGAGAASAITEGRMRAQNYKASGRQAFMSGLTNAATTFGGIEWQ